jgi:hypothetical protein
MQLAEHRVAHEVGVAYEGGMAWPFMISTGVYKSAVQGFARRKSISPVPNRCHAWCQNSAKRRYHPMRPVVLNVTKSLRL